MTESKSVALPLGYTPSDAEGEATQFFGLRSQPLCGNVPTGRREPGLVNGDALRADVARRPVRFRKFAHHHAVTGTGVNEFAVAEIDADVRDAAIGVEKDEVSGFRAAHRRPTCVVLRIGGARQRDPEHAEDVLHETRAIEPG